MKRVTGLGGVFFKCKDPENIKQWYREHLGLPTDQYGAVFKWRDADDNEREGATVWSPFPEDTSYYDPSNKPFMLNYRVENLEALMRVLKDEGVEVIGEIEEYDYGKFGWIMDPEGNKIELWEPADNRLSNG